MTASAIGGGGKGFGVDIKDSDGISDETGLRIVGNDVIGGPEEGERRAMENFPQKDPGVNLVCTINEPAAAGAYEALRAAVLSARRLVKRCGGVVALNDADFELRAGEILAVIGATAPANPR